MITTERIAELRTILDADLLDQGTAFYMACDDLPQALDTIEVQAARIAEIEVDLRRLANARQAHINAVDHYNRMREIMRSKEPGAMNITAEYHAMEDCRSDFIDAAQDVARRQITRAALQPKGPS